MKTKATVGLNREELENLLLDDIEASTDRLYNKSIVLKEESKIHNKLIDNIHARMTSATDSLSHEAEHVAQASQSSTGGFCWMYTVIYIELFIMILLLFSGLT